MALSGFSELKRDLRKWENNVHSETRQYHDETLQSMQRKGKRYLKLNDVNASEELSNSFIVSQTGRIGGDYQRSRLSNIADYGPYVEHGTGRKGDGRYRAQGLDGQLIRSIKNWMIIKPVTPLYTLNQSAFLIARSISEEGTSPQPFWTYTTDGWKGKSMVSTRNAIRSATNKTF